MTELSGSHNDCPAVRRNDHICDFPGPRGCRNAQSFRRSSRGSRRLWDTHKERKTAPESVVGATDWNPGPDPRCIRRLHVIMQYPDTPRLDGRASVR